MTKALTLHQPHASLVALGVKPIETRGWSTSYRGPLVIHAGAAMTRAQRSIAYADPIGAVLNEHGIMLGGDCAALPGGAVVASCTLADVVPIAHLSDYPLVPTIDNDHGTLTLFRGEQDGRGRHQQAHDLSEQFAYGDFTPGRFAWLLEDVAPTTERCPACWGAPKGIPRERIEGGSRNCAHCNRTLTFNMMRDRDVEPCDCAGARADRCPSCSGAGVCDPVPARGRQGLWNWERTS